LHSPLSLLGKVLPTADFKRTTMVNQRKSVEHLFEQALALKASERSAFLDEACSSSPELREKVARLLDEDAQAGSFLNSPLFGRPNTAGPLDGATAETWPHDPEDSQRVDTVPDGCFSDNDILAGRFRIVRFIAAGGMGEVYEVEDRQLQGVRLALKTILPHIAANPHMQERFEREVLLARRIVHPNLCPIYDIFRCRHQDTDLMFLTMKLLPGETLASRIKREGAIPLDEARRIVSQVGAALAAAHDAGILHRDIKTANIMIAGSGEQVHAWVTDFGLARAYQGETTVLTADGVAGTPGYVAPELFLGVPPSKASDVYAFGVVIYKMVTGFSPPVRLDPKAKVTRDPFTEQLPAEWKRLIEHCLEPSVEKRCQGFPEVVGSLRGGDRRKQVVSGIAAKLSRRRFVAMGAGAAAAVAGGVWLDWTQIDFAMHPLPPKRFVALLDWPTAPDARIAPMMTAVVDAIGNELARAEAFDHNLYIIPHHIGKDVASLSQLNVIRESLGANLVLAASGAPGAKGVELLLRVLDPASRTLREKTIRVSADEQLSLPEKAVRVAAELLNIASYQPDDQRSKVGTANPEAYTAFQAAETLRSEENDRGLDAAIGKYKQAIEIDPHFAVASAKLALAYFRYYILHRDSAALELAHENCQSAIAENPNLVEAHLALASVLDWTGDKPAALREISKALSIDPGNPSALLYQGQTLTRCNRWHDAEETLSRLVTIRPNYWLGHDEFGVAYGWQGKYAEAAAEFRAASLAAPQRVAPLTNLSTVYLEMGKPDDAVDIAKKALSLAPDDEAAASMAAALRCKGKYGEAVAYALQATRLNPDEPENWLELGDCYSCETGRQPEAKDAFARMTRLQEQSLQTNPSEGPGWMLLALAQAKLMEGEQSLKSLRTAENNFAGDLDSQLLKLRTLELLGRHDEAFVTASACFVRGVTPFQFQFLPDIDALRNSPQFKDMLVSPPVPKTNS
jgi:eukaryotic-like serine/threonine-protein kinase